MEVRRRGRIVVMGVVVIALVGLALYLHMSQHMETGRIPCGFEPITTIRGELQSSDDPQTHMVPSGTFSYYACTLELQLSEGRFPPGLNVDLAVDGDHITNLYTGGPDHWYIVLPAGKEVELTVRGNLSLANSYSSSNRRLKKFVAV